MTNKKGTGIKPAPQTHPHNNKIQTVCLILFGIFLILAFCGKFLNNDRLLVFGFGVGAAVSIITVTNLIMKGE